MDSMHLRSINLNRRKSQQMANVCEQLVQSRYKILNFWDETSQSHVLLITKQPQLFCLSIITFMAAKHRLLAYYCQY